MRIWGGALRVEEHFTLESTHDIDSKIFLGTPYPTLLQVAASIFFGYNNGHIPETSPKFTKLKWEN